MERPTASSVARGIDCPASAALPAIETTSDAADRGNGIHKFLADALVAGGRVALDAVELRYRLECAAIDLEGLLRHVGEGERSVEVAFAYDVATCKARRLGVSLGRRYAIEESEIAGTADLVVRRPDGSVEVIDYKTGYAERAADSLQLRTLGLMVATALELDAITVTIAKLNENGTWSFDSATLGAMDLDAHGAELSDMAVRVRKARATVEAGRVPDVYPSANACRWCPCKASCPAQSAMARAVLSEAPGVVNRVLTLEPAEAGQWYVRAREAMALLTQILDGLDTYARETPIPLPSGRRLVLVETSRESINGTIAATEIARLYGEAVAKAACPPATSKAAIERALSSPGEVREALAAIGAAGGVLVKRTQSVKERAHEHLDKEGFQQDQPAPRRLSPGARR